MPRFLILVALLAASACATMSPEARVRQKLLDAGLKPRMAECLAGRLVDRLSIGQLKELGRVASLPGRNVGRMSFDELLFRLKAIQDPEIVAVVTRAGLGCAIAG